MTACGDSLEKSPALITPYLDNDNVDLYVGMEFNSVTNIYNFYNAYVRRVDFRITTVCSRSNKKNYASNI